MISRLISFRPCATILSTIFLMVDCLLASQVPGIADIAIDGDKLTVTTANLAAYFKGADLVRLHNRLTQEEYIHTTTRKPLMLDMGMLKPTGKGFFTAGWQQGRSLNANPDAAQIQYNDLTRSIWMNVVVDPKTQDITVALWGTANREGVTGLTWGLQGLDLTSGRLVLPAKGGRYVDSKSEFENLSLAYPGDWEAQMLVWEGKGGGFVIYTRDERVRYKRLNLKRSGNYADLGLETQSEAPWERTGGVPQLEWRINTFKGDWRVPATGYRNLMHFYHPPVPAAGGRAWANEIRTVTTIKGNQYDPVLLNELAKQLDPKKTLLYLPDWRRDGFNSNYPNYEWNESLPAFVERAHSLGFHVMLHADLSGVSPGNPDYNRVRPYQVKDPRTAKPLGNHWDRPETDPQRFAYINPAVKYYRDLLLMRLRSVMDEVQPDALQLGDSVAMYNDGNGPLENKNYAEGAVALYRALLTVYPNLILAGEGTNELTSPYMWFAQRGDRDPLQPHPVSAFLFGDHVLTYGTLEQPNPDQSPAEFRDYFSTYEAQGVSPTPVLTSAADIGPDRAGMKRVMDQVRAWQEHEFTPDWTGELQTARFRWVGSDNTKTAVLVQSGGTQVKIGEESLYRLVRGVNQLVSPDFIAGWPAYDDGAVYGLDPKRSYWLETRPRPTGALHVSSLPPGVLLKEAQITPEFALFNLTTVSKAALETPASVTISLPSGTTVAGLAGTAKAPAAENGILTYKELSLPATLLVFLKSGLAVSAGQDLLEVPHDLAMESGGMTASGSAYGSGKIVTTTCGGASKDKAINANPPGQGKTLLSWVIKVPDSDKSSLSFNAGLADGSQTNGVGFMVLVNGEKAWEWSTKESKWNPGTVDLSRWRNQTVLLQLITDAQGDNAYDWARWAEVGIR
jgi:hypothetical protein